MYLEGTPRQGGDARAEAKVNSRRHAARVAPENLHRTEAAAATFKGAENACAGAMEADPFEQPYWNLDQYLIWLASCDPAAVLNAADHPNSRTNPPIGWWVHQKLNVDPRRVETEAIRAIKGRDIKACVEFNGEWITPDDLEWFADWVIEFEGEPTFAALLMRSTKHGRREKVRPRFNPRRVAGRYPPPTPSNVRDRPDVENPDVGPFIAYFDAWYWLAERISLGKLLPIDEADPLAEKTIRYICMNTPEKLTMWGFRKGDPDAELKAVSPQAWQGLSINPLAGQPEADLKAVGYRREYGAATKGEYGPVIWTGLCFNRKQFVAAVSGVDLLPGGNGPPSLTDAARPIYAPISSPHGEEERQVQPRESSDLKAGELARVRHGGRPPEYDWPRIKAHALEVLQEHGEPHPDDRDLPSQEALVNRILSFCSDTFGREPGASTVRMRVPQWLNEFRASKRGF